MLTPNATLTNRCKGMGRPMRSCIRFISTSVVMPRAPPPSKHTTPAPAVGGGVHLDSYIARWSLSAKEAVADVKRPGIVVAAISEHDHAIFADDVSAGQSGRLRSSTQTAQTCSAALDAVPPALEARKVVSVDVCCCLAANELFEVADKVVYDQVGDAALQVDIFCLS